MAERGEEMLQTHRSWWVPSPLRLMMVSSLTPRKYAFSLCDHVDFESAVTEQKSKRSVSELVNVMARDTECELVCKRAKLSPLRRYSVPRSSCGCVTERNCLPSNMSHVLARVRDVLIEFTVNTNLPFRTAKSFQLLEIWTNPTIREAAFRSLGE